MQSRSNPSRGRQRLPEQAATQRGAPAEDALLGPTDPLGRANEMRLTVALLRAAAALTIEPPPALDSLNRIRDLLCRGARPDITLPPSDEFAPDGRNSRLSALAMMVQCCAALPNNPERHELDDLIRLAQGREPHDEDDLPDRPRTAADLERKWRAAEQLAGRGNQSGGRTQWLGPRGSADHYERGRRGAHKPD